MWCDSDNILVLDSHDDSDDDPEERTVLVAGSDSSLSNLPAVVVMDPATGATLYTVTLTSGSVEQRDEAVFENGQWKVRLLSVQAAAAAEGGLTILLDGVHTEEHSDAHVHESIAEADRVIAHEQPHAEATATERKESSRRRTQVPPPPVTFYNYFTWRVDSV